MLASRNDGFFVARVAKTSTIKLYCERRSLVIGLSFGGISWWNITSGSGASIPTIMSLGRRFIVFKKLAIQA